MIWGANCAHTPHSFTRNFTNAISSFRKCFEMRWDEPSKCDAYWIEDVFEPLLKNIHRIRIHRSNDWKKNEFDDSNFGPLSISIHLLFNHTLWMCVWVVFFAFSFFIWSACVSFVCEIFFSVVDVVIGCVSFLLNLLSGFSQIWASHNSLCAISFFLFPSFVLFSFSLCSTRPTDRANSLIFTLSRLCVCACFCAPQCRHKICYALFSSIRQECSRRDR